MSHNLLLALIITLVGMGLVFLAIIVLWLLMLGLTAMIVERARKVPDDSEELERKKKAAAVAVSIAISQQTAAGISPFPLPPTATVSAWQLTMRTEHLRKRGLVR
jgi:Na+-transporting methylmalonyl-CoA/oxaloacetate decarboxylase gamma subunit